MVSKDVKSCIETMRKSNGKKISDYKPSKELKAVVENPPNGNRRNLKGNPEDVQQTEILSKLEDERARKRAYWHANKRKLTGRVEAAKLEQMKVKCSELKLPIILADHINFNKPTANKPDRISLKFNSKADLINFIINIKMADDLHEAELRELKDTFAKELPKEDD